MMSKEQFQKSMNMPILKNIKSYSTYYVSVYMLIKRNKNMYFFSKPRM